ncbi:UNVERIFIED_CONTAM: Histone-arginine methyltransferase carm1 [Gekko kuhli]
MVTVVKFKIEYSLFSNALKNCRNQKKEHSVFNQRTEEASAAQYFQVAVHCITILSEFYGCLSQQQNMMQDFVRTATYHRAILQNHIDFKDKDMCLLMDSSENGRLKKSCQE